MLRNYVSAALRNLVRNRFYAGLMIIGLAVAFTAAILIGLFMRDEDSYDRWIPGYERIFLASQLLTPPGGRAQAFDSTRSDIAGLLKLDFPQIEAVTRLARAEPLLRHGQTQAAEPDFLWADPNLFDVLPMQAIAGDPDAALRRPDGLVLTRALARKYFGRDTPVGEILEVDPAFGPEFGPVGARVQAFNSFHPMRVGAVIEDLPSNTHLKIQAIGSGLAAFSQIARLDAAVQPFGQAAYTYLKLKPGADAEALRRALPAFVARRIPLGPLLGGRIALALTPIARVHLAPPAARAMQPRGDPNVIAAIAAIGALIVLVASINFVTLMTARAARRALEVGVRKAVGATRRDLIVQFLGEAVILVSISMLAAVSLAELLLPAINGFLQRQMRFDYVRDPLVIVVAFGGMIVIAVLSGLYPALVLSAFRPATVLKGGLQPPGSGAPRRALVVMQFAILVGLIVSTITLYRQTAFALDRALRFQEDQVVWAWTLCSAPLRDRMATLPGVRAAACSGGESMDASDGAPTTALTTDGRAINVQMAAVDFNLFDFYRIRPIAGRLLGPAHGADGALLQGPSPANPSVVLNQSAVRALGFSSPAAAIGKTVPWRRLVMEPGRAPVLLARAPSQIVGVVADFSMGSVREPIQPAIYYVDPGLFGLLSVKLDGASATQALKAMDDLWRSLGNPRPLHRQFMTQATRDLYADVIRQGMVVAACAGLAVLIAGLGLFGLAAFTTEQRTREIGVRKAMGASRTDILRLLLWQFTKPVLIANLIAWPVTGWLMQRWLAGFTAHITLDPAPFLSAAAATLLIASAAVLGHTLKVAAAEPVRALRYE